MVTSLVVCVEPYRHEVTELHGEPHIEVLGVRSDQVATNEDVENSSNERDLFSGSYGLCVVPSAAQAIHRVPHTLSVLVKLLVRGRKPPSPFFDNSILGIDA